MKLATVLQWLAYLACPLMMLWCMRGMFRRGGEHHPGSCSDETATGDSREVDAEIRDLKARLAELETERGTIRPRH